jgi:hypothetical protein
MISNIRNGLLLIAAYTAIVWFLLPAWASWEWGLSSMIRLDPQVSKDYNCIYVEGYSYKAFKVHWLSHSTPADYIRIRYTPNGETQDYGIMFVDPRSFAYEAHTNFTRTPIHLSARLDSEKPVLDWIDSQPHSTQSPSHTNDAQEIYQVVRELTPKDLEHFTLPAGYKLNNFMIKYQFPVKRGGPDWLSCTVLLVIVLQVVLNAQKRRTPNRLIKK